MNDIYILGVGHNTPVIIELAELNNYTVKGLYNYEVDVQSIYGVPVLGTYDDLFESELVNGCYFALSMGNNDIRCALANKIREKGGELPTLVHPTASVSKYAIIERGVIIQANSTIQADVLIKQDTVISFNVGVTHSTEIGVGCYIACQSIVGAYITLHDYVFIGMGSTIVSNKVPYIGEKAIVGAGSVVVKPVEAFSTVVGNPARVLTEKRI